MDEASVLFQQDTESAIKIQFNQKQAKFDHQRKQTNFNDQKIKHLNDINSIINPIIIHKQGITKVNI